ncbi:hypothetical protein [Vibrio parahaemolyticus]|uniref:hypothetical protein n=1 Tax=Vibrio TaxID=662 RepID=UPI00111089D2|nr:hypothetical protein [Vibrio parahaemolyticus]MDF4881304.1 hypothetical protein [Vibrio parahaemolyticus]MDF5393154.1 hypothetical protein [Vibrio parahaemolyticus]MDF5399081.1 hypothetical protein [Vibrio parahaemolyticus]QRH13486.1 hypothetical protein JCT84_03355 [Vibrio parahaemolyticus]TMX36628.1 hypothetical protein DA098_17470 [Vibrio parahaemolyticus]
MELMTVFKGATTALSIINSKLTNRKADRALIELANGQKSIKEICNDSNEVFRFTQLIDSLNRASTYAKANVLKDLYLAFDTDEKNEESDDFFFETFSILGELSDREIHILYLLERYHQENIKNKRSDAQYSKYFESITEEGFGVGGSLSDSFYYFAADKLGLEAKFLTGLMKRLERSGLIIQTGIDANARFQEYTHTDLYREIKTRLVIAMENTYGNGEKLTSAEI